MNRNIFLLWQGQLISQLGTQAFSIAMMFWLMENIGSSIIMGVILTLSILPSIFLGPISGVVADKTSKKKIIILTDCIRGISVLFLSLALIFGINEQQIIITLFAITALINGICRAFFQPAIDAWIPEITSKEQLPKTMALFNTSSQCTNILGQALGGILYKILGAPVLLLLDAISYLLSAMSECFIKTEETIDYDKKLNLRSLIRNYKADLIEGLHYVKSKHGMFPTMFFASSINFFIAPFMLLLPFYVVEQLSSPAQWYGFLLAGMGAGSLLGFWASAILKPIGNQRAIIMFSSIFTLSFCLFCLSQSFVNITSLLYISIVGFCLGVFNLQSMTLFQTSSPSKIRGRIMGLLMTISSAFLPLGLIISGGLGEITNNDTQLIFSVAALLLALFSVYFICSSNVRSFLFVKN